MGKYLSARNGERCSVRYRTKGDLVIRAAAKKLGGVEVSMTTCGEGNPPALYGSIARLWVDLLIYRGVAETVQGFPSYQDKPLILEVLPLTIFLFDPSFLQAGRASVCEASLKDKMFVKVAREAADEIPAH
jgi:hypothetical protein